MPLLFTTSESTTYANYLGPRAHLIDQINKLELELRAILDGVLFFIRLALGCRLSKARYIGAGDFYTDFVGNFHR